MSKQSRKAGPIRLRRVALAQMKAAMRSNVIVQPHEMHNLEWIEANSATFSKYAGLWRLARGPHQVRHRSRMAERPQAVVPAAR